MISFKGNTYTHLHSIPSQYFLNLATATFFVSQPAILILTRWQMISRQAEKGETCSPGSLDVASESWCRNYPWRFRQLQHASSNILNSKQQSSSRVVWWTSTHRTKFLNFRCMYSPNSILWWQTYCLTILSLAVSQFSLLSSTFRSMSRNSYQRSISLYGQLFLCEPQTSKSSSMPSWSCGCYLTSRMMLRLISCSFIIQIIMYNRVCLIWVRINASQISQEFECILGGVLFVVLVDLYLDCLQISPQKIHFFMLGRVQLLELVATH